MSRLIDPNEVPPEPWHEDPAEREPACDPECWHVVTAKYRLPCSRAFPSREQAERCAHWLYRPGSVAVEQCRIDYDDVPF